MCLTLCLYILAVFASQSTCLYASSLFQHEAVMPLLGVDPVHLARFEGANFRCGESTIPMKRVNDNFCDCPDGTDEPGTSACSSGRFFCVNSGFRSKTIPSSMVNDGICDCCDGSDEYSGLMQCHNICDQLAVEASAHLVQKLQVVNEGLQEREKRIESVQPQKAEHRKRLEEVQKLKGEMQEQLQLLQQEMDEADRLAREEKEAKEKAEEAAKASIVDIPVGENNVTGAETSAKVDQPVPEDSAAVPGDDSVDGDQPVPKSIETPAGDTAAGETAGVEGEAEAFPYPEQYAFHDSEDEIKPEEEDDEPEFADLNPEPEPEQKTPLQEAADLAREKHSELKNSLSSMESEETDIKRILDFDHGPNDVFLSLEGKCFEKTVNQYVYEVCPFNAAFQKEGSRKTSLGTFSDWAEKYSRMSFTEGERCWNGPKRSVTVIFECGVSEELLSVQEPSTCVYEMRLSSPASCSEEEKEDLVQQLNLLSVSQPPEQQPQPPEHDEL